MKLLFCPACQDIIKLTVSELRRCACGAVRGQYDADGHHAVTNGRGVCLGLDNNTLFAALQNDPTKRHEITVWTRPHSGPDNPRSRVNRNLGRRRSEVP